MISVKSDSGKYHKGEIGKLAYRRNLRTGSSPVPSTRKAIDVLQMRRDAPLVPRHGMALCVGQEIRVRSALQLTPAVRSRGLLQMGMEDSESGPLQRTRFLKDMERLLAGFEIEGLSCWRRSYFKT